MSQKRLLSILTALLLIGGFGLWSALDIDSSDGAEKQEEARSQGVKTATTTQLTTTVTSTKPTNAVVIDVIDGDTLDIKYDDGAYYDEPGMVYRVRLLGVNTPETVDPRRPVQCYGKEASSFSKKTLNGKRVRLEADPEADEYDKYGRLLRNVFLEDGTDFNANLVAEGYANAYVSFPQNAERKAQLRRLESEAKTNKLGLWNPTICP